MAQHKEFESLDELFRKTFDSLPETPSSSGWDVPSDKVWQHVQTQIAPPKTGWSTLSWSLVASLGVALVLGLYFSLRTTESTATQQPATSVVTTAPLAAQPTQPEASVATVPTTISEVPETKVKPLEISKKTTKNKSIAAKPELANQASRLANKQAQESQPIPGINPIIVVKNSGEATLLPGIKAKTDDPQNTTEKLRQEGAVAWKKNLTPLTHKPIRSKTRVTLPSWMKK